MPVGLWLAFLGPLAVFPTSDLPAGPRFEIEFTQEAVSEIASMGLEVPIVGRVFVIATRDTAREPRSQVRVTGVPFWGMNVRDIRAGQSVVMEAGNGQIYGYPLERLTDLPAGSYHVQAFLTVYTTFRRADGHTVEMHLNSGAGQNLWRAPGNAYSAPLEISWDPKSDATVRLRLTEVIQPIEPLQPGEVLQQGNPRDTDWVKFVKIKSELLSEFWGRDMYIGANILLPRDYYDEPDRHYPVLYLQGHFPGRRAPLGFTERSESNRRGAATYEYWTSDSAPKVIAVTFRDANPIYDTSYEINSANMGPSGDATVRELIPYIEERFRGIGESWARVLAGGSTGGWEALALQVFYPDDFGGSWGWCPDPVDFNYYQIVNVYEDENAYHSDRGWMKVERPNQRRPDGNIVSTVRQENLFELAAGPNSRAGGQWDIWEALFGPVGDDGYPKPIWDKRTGEIDHEVAEYWREHYDITDYLKRNWATIGPKLAGKINVAVGDMDSFYLNEGVYLLQEFLDSADNPPANASFDYGWRKPHCWIGESPNRPGESMSYVEWVEIAAQHMWSAMPAGADRGWWER
jgi:hypothetical protein